jgi:dipeptidase D
VSKAAVLQPKSVWNAFRELSKVPRGSGNETAVMNMLKEWADTRNLKWKQDRVGNLLITIPASEGMGKKPPVLVQGHVDMVCEKNSGTKHDFETDPIKLQIKGDWITADGTTLGADNGLGVAMGLAVADEKNMKHPRIEVLLTVDEERGLTGAAGIEEGFFESRRMINLDSEEEDAIFMGCAGGRDTELHISNRKTRLAKGYVARKLTIRGLLGGHSGLDIIRNRGNAIKILTRCLVAARDAVPLKLVSIDGGSMRNAIPREAEARVIVPEGNAREFKKIVDALAGQIASKELAGIDDSLEAKVTSCKVSRSWGAGSTTRTLGLLDALPNGVLGMSQAIDGLVETSTSVGVVKTDGSRVTVVCCSRSSSMSALEAVVRQHRTIGELAGARVVQPEGYPGWMPNPKSKMVQTTARLYERVFKKEARLTAIHAGLECGLLTEKYPDMDIVSFGPDIRGAHSPDEKASISSTRRIWKLFRILLSEL